MSSTAQLEFDHKYITAAEVMKKLGISRTQLLYARRTGKLPNPIILNGRLFIWERKDVQEYLDAWLVMLNAKRAE